MRSVLNSKSSSTNSHSRPRTPRRPLRWRGRSPASTNLAGAKQRRHHSRTCREAAMAELNFENEMLERKPLPQQQRVAFLSGRVDEQPPAGKTNQGWGGTADSERGTRWRGRERERRRRRRRFAVGGGGDLACCTATATPCASMRALQLIGFGRRLHRRLHRPRLCSWKHTVPWFKFVDAAVGFSPTSARDGQLTAITMTDYS